MSLGKNCELDHIVPISRGGSNTPDNTQWVLMVCNRMKDNLTEQEFFELVKKIYITMEREREAKANSFPARSL